METKAYKLIGTTDEVTECGCCGKTGLKGTVVLLDTVTDQYVWFGSSCGARALGWTVQQFDAEALAAQIAREFDALLEQRNGQRGAYEIVAQGRRGARRETFTIWASTIEELYYLAKRKTGYIREPRVIIHSVKAV